MLAAILTLCGNVTVFGQEADEQFSVATLNVDGLPQKILVVKVNADGPGDIGTARIGKYLLKKGYDIVMMQEDFNYHGILSVFLEDDYKMDEWSGDVGIEGHTIDFLHLQNHRFECDGLMACWKNDLTVKPVARTAWTQSFGKFSHANDELVTKGFRRYEVTLRDGTDIVVYNMHMDATLEEDEAENNAVKDHEARMAQWAQLKADVLEQLDTRPIIITGDLNSLYGRDDVKGEFIDAINETGRGTAHDVWVELQKGGVYPTAKTEAEAGDETLDKIIYINPTEGDKIQPVSVSIDREGYVYDGMPLGDHWPVAAKFRVVSSKSVGISTTLSDKGEKEKVFYNLNGQRVSQPRNGVYIKDGQKTVIR
jgi:endonuclease/exonuclease/phosphatase family metal-dependent hydrolase